MARTRDDAGLEIGRLLRRLIVVALAALALLSFALWRAESPRIVALRMDIIDMAAPSLEWTAGPIRAVSTMSNDFSEFLSVYERNKELRREIQRLRAWREAAEELERENAQLRALNNVRLSTRTSFVTGEIIADGGGPFSHSVLANIGEEDGVRDGAAAVDGAGLVGRVVGVGDQAARLLLVTDINSRVPAKILPSGRRTVVVGDNSAAPRLAFLGSIEDVSRGDQVVTSGEGGVYPPDIPVGRIAVLGERAGRIAPAADFARLEFVRILRYDPPTRIDAPGGLITPNAALYGPPAPEED